MRNGSPQRISEFIAAAVVSSLLAVGLTKQFNQALIVHLIRSVAEDHGLDPDHFLRMAEIESGYDPNAMHPKSKASGLFQFIPSTARQYRLRNVFDPWANSEAAADLWQDNARMLGKHLRREPRPGEIYLAHQQGATGAISLLTNPGQPATKIVGHKAVVMNGGTEDMTAEAFAAMWVDRFESD